jgi:hypothetical protein
MVNLVALRVSGGETLKLENEEEEEESVSQQEAEDFLEISDDPLIHLTNRRMTPTRS